MIYPVIIYFVLCLLVAIYGRRSKLGFLGTLCASIFLTPVVCFIALTLLSPNVLPVPDSKDKAISKG
jgi:hypothetical protein